MGLEVVKGFMGSRQPAPIQQESQPIREVNPENEVPVTPIQVPMNDEEMKRFAGVVGMLRPFAGMIVRMINTAGWNAASAELADYVPGRLEDSLLEFATLATERGASALAIIDPALATPDGLKCLQGIAAIIKESQQ